MLSFVRHFLPLVATGMLVFALVGCVPVNGQRIVGAWMLTDVPNAEKPQWDVILEFTGDGDFYRTKSWNGTEKTVQGTYSVDENELALIYGNGVKSRENNYQIRHLSTRKLTLVNHLGMTSEYKRIQYVDSE